MKKDLQEEKGISQGYGDKVGEIGVLQDEGVGTKVKYNLPRKMMVNVMDGIGTKKLKTDSFSQLCDRILSQTQKISTIYPLQEKSLIDQSHMQQFTSLLPSKLTYDPHYHTGVIQNYVSVTSQQQKQQFGLSSEGRCQHFMLNDKFIIVIVGRLPTSYCDGMNIALYLPRQLVQNPLNIRSNTKQLVIVQRLSHTNDSNFLNYPYIILQPQILLYPSYLCSWIECKRRVSLVNYISSEFEVNQHLVFGSACHRYMEWLLDEEVKVNLQSYQQWKDVIKKVYDSFLYDMYLVGATFERFFEYCQQSLTNIRQWVRMYILNKRQLEVNKYQRLYLRIEKVIGSETMHRSGYFGLKGKTDGLFKGKLINKKTNTITDVYIPFQLKTGRKPSESHKRQTDIYNMLLRQRQKTPVVGLLYYSQGNFTIFRQQNKEVAFQTIVIHRNTIVMNLKRLYQGEEIVLPELTINGDNCKFCQMAVSCEVIEERRRNKVTEREKQLREKKRQRKRCKQQQKQQQQQQNEQMKQVTTIVKSQPPFTDSKTIFLNSLFDSSSQSQSSQNYPHSTQQALPSTYNDKSKLILSTLSFSQRRYFNSWIQRLHLQQRQIKQQLQKNTTLGYSNFVLTKDQLQRINSYFHLTKLQQKLTFSVQKKCKSLTQMNKLVSNYTVSLKLRIIIQHLGIMEGCKITKLVKLQNKLVLELQMNSLQVVMNRRALEYSILNGVEHDVQLERFENLQVASWRWALYRFVLGGNERLKQLVIDQYQSKQIKQDKLNHQADEKQQFTQIVKQSQSTVDVTNRDDGSKSKLLLDKQQKQIIINNNDDQIINNDKVNVYNEIVQSSNYCSDEHEVDDEIIELSHLQPLTMNNQCEQYNCKLKQQQQLLRDHDDKTQYLLTSTLNADQLQAFNRVFCHSNNNNNSNNRQKQSYCTLVEGMPGTGKTQLIVKLILQAYLLKQTVLITTYTNRSLDNILQRLFKQSHYTISSSHIIRQGSRYSIDPKFQTLNHRYYNFTTIQQYTSYFSSKRIWFVTLSSINIHHIPKQFDLVILDQASQSLQPVCIEALNRGKRIVMIGDYKQLQPIVKSRKAGEMGMAVSLFERLCIKYTGMTVALRMQYRMNKEIMALSNKLVYDGQLALGSQVVQHKTLLLPPTWQQSLHEPTLQQIISPLHPVVFLNHDGITNSLSSKHRQSYNQISHVLQIQCAVYLYCFLLQSCGIKEQQMAIVCAYNRTVDVVNQMIQLKRVRGGCDVRSNGQSPQLITDNNSVNDQITTNLKKHTHSTPALTIDKSQGIDKQVIIFIVEAQSQDSHCLLLQSSRRMNVALTRAKTKLILIGSTRYLKQMQLWDGKLALMLQQSTYNMTKPLIDYILGQFTHLKQQQLAKQVTHCQHQQQQIQIIDEETIRI